MEKWKRRFQRGLCILLATIMVVESSTVVIVDATENEPILLNTVHSNIGEIDETYSHFSIGTVQSEVEEKGSYILTIYRDGNIYSEATVDLVSADISAKYGKDYIVEDDNITEEHKTDQTVLEMTADEEYQKITAEITEKLEDAIESSMETEEAEAVEEPEEAEAVEETEEVEVVEELEEVEAVEEKAEEKKEISPLAQIKEEQTGLPTRETYEAEGLPLQDVLFENLGVDLGQEIITSSTMHLVFKPGEVEKQVVFRILEDEESEGQELINFLLTAPDENSMLTDFFSIGISINDDEPVVHSTVSFSATEYTAEGNQVVVKIVREKALYSLVTVRIHSNETGDAKTAVNFAGVNEVLEFAPYQEEVSVTIPVIADKDMEFELALTEFKGGVEGEYTKATVHIKPTEDMITSANEQSTFSLCNAKSDEKSNVIYIQGVEYELEKDNESSVWRILDHSKNPKVHVGNYYLPTPTKKTSSSNVSGMAGNVEYEISRGDSGRQYNRYVEQEKYGHLCWYSSLVWEKGAEVARYNIDITPYQYLALDYRTLSDYDSSSCGFELNIRNNNDGASRYLEFKKQGPQSRTVSEPVLLYGNKDGVTWTPDTWGENTEINIVAERTARYLVEPEIHFWGLVGMFKTYEISVEQPDELSYRNGDGMVEKRPARAVLSSGHDKRTLGQDFTILYSSIEEGGSINGELIGYDVKFGKETEYHRYVTTDTSLSLSGDFLEFVEQYAPKNIEIKGKDSYVTKMKIKPVFDYKDVRVEINQSEYGTFDDANLKQTTTDVFHVGDVIKISATAYDKYKDYEYESYESEAYANPGDTKPEESGVIPGSYELKFKKVRYALTPIFTQQKNVIEIQLDQEAQKYFTVTNIIPKEQLAYSDMKGKNILYIEEPLDGETHTRPVYGKVYEVALKPTEQNDGTYRPLITQSLTGQTVNGYCMYVIAYERANKNIIKVSAEKCNPKDYQLFALDGYARYSSVSLRQSVTGLLNEPATNVIASTATVNTKLYGNSGAMDWFLQMNNGGNKLIKEVNENGIETSKLVEGSYEINGISAIPGDTISVKLTNNDVEQVQYVKLSTAGKTVEERIIEYKEADGETQSNKIVTKSEMLTIVESAPVDMPVRTPYSPYVSDISYDYLKNSIDPSVNSIPIIYGDSPDILTVTADVELNGHDQEKLDVVFYLKDKKGNTVLKETGQFNEKTKQYFWDLDPSAMASDGDRIFVQIVSAGIEYSTLNTGLSFYTQAQEIVEYRMSVEPGDYANGIPVMSNLSALVDTGKMKFGKAEYEDPNNKATSPYSRTFSVSVSVKELLENKEELDKIKNGKAEQEKTDVTKDISDAVNAVTDDYIKNWLKKKDSTFASKSAADQQKEIDANRKTLKQKAEDDARKNFKKNSLAEISKKVKWDIKVSVIFRLEYLYSEEENSHIYAGSQYAVGVMGEVKNVHYWLLGNVPVFLSMAGWASFQLDGATTTDKGIITEADMLGYKNLADLPVKTSMPWAQFGLGIKLQPGVGYCGLLSVRGIFEASTVFRVNASSQLAHDEANKGARFKILGGVGLDLMLFTVDYTFEPWVIETGVYHPVYNKYNMRRSSGYITEVTLESNEAVEEQNSLMGKDVMLRSSLEPISKKDLIQGTLEYIRPAMTTLPDGRVFMVYLQNGKDRSNANESQLVYSIRSTNGVWSKPVVVDPDNQTAETSPSILCVGNKVYIAWSYANKALTGSNEVEAVKDELQSMDIKLCVFDAENDSLSQVKIVCSDQFMDNYVRMNEEGESIAIYYLKEDLSAVTEIEDFTSLTSNYNTWVKVIYDPANDEFVEQSVSTGTVTEKLMNLVHPTIHDPLVTDYGVSRVEYDDEGYNFAVYSVDTDKNIETDGDKELWLELSIGDKVYKPIRMNNNSGYVSNLQMTQLGDDAFITWVSETSVFNSISLREVLESLDAEVDENGVTSLSYIANADGTEFGWADAVAASSEASILHELNNFAEGKLHINSVDFATPNTEMRKEADIFEYKVVRGSDDNIYMFWTGGTCDEDNLGTEIFGTTYYKLDENWQEQWESNMPESGWGKPVQITNYGKDVEGGIVLDEIDVVIQKDKGAVIIANSFEIDINDETGEVEYGSHNLTEITCKPTSSLKIVNDEIALSEEHPLPGEKIDVSFNIKNDGLLPSEGNRVSLSVVLDGKVLATKEELETDVTDIIYVGNEFRYSTSLKIPGKLSYPFQLVAEVQELTKDANGEFVPIGDIYTVERTIDYNSDFSLGEIKDYNRVELAQFLVDKEAGDEIYDAYQHAIATQKNAETFTHAYFIPVKNAGNKETEEFEIYVEYVDSDFNVGDVLGQSEKTTVKLRETKYVCVLVEEKPEYFREVAGQPIGMTDTKVAVKVNGREISTYESHHTIYENTDIGIIVNNGKEKISLNQYKTKTIDVKGYPFDVDDKDVYIESMDESIIVVSNEGVITALNGGTTSVKVTDIKTGQVEVLTVTVAGKASDNDQLGDNNDQPSDDNNQPNGDNNDQPSDDNNQPNDDNNQPNGDNNDQPSDDNNKPNDENNKDDSVSTAVTIKEGLLLFVLVVGVGVCCLLIFKRRKQEV